jgi:hypothetical protein
MELKSKRLEPWEEARGMLKELDHEDDYVVLDFDKFKIHLDPIEVRTICDQLNKGLVGRRIAILRTDLPDKPLLVRRL